jgi:3-isopropylmalate/(R)-2-methylmalate dehydratase small subunit
VIAVLIRDRVFGLYGDNIPTEAITASRHVSSITPEGLAAACMKDIDPEFHRRLTQGKIMVAGSNFGCSSSREWAPVALKASGVRLIIARSFARIFFRNALNIGLPILECPELAASVAVGDELEVDLGVGVARNLSRGTNHRFQPLPEFLLAIVEAGGLLEVLRREVRAKKGA